MKILHIITALSYKGGAEKLIFHISKNQNKNNDVTVITFECKDSFINELTENNIKAQLFNLKFYNIIFYFIKLVLMIRKEKYNIVHTHLPKAAYIGRLSAIIAGNKNIVNTVHRIDNWLDKNTLSNKLLLFIDKKLNNYKFSKVISVSKDVEKYLIKCEPEIDKDKLFILHNTIDMDDMKKRLQEPGFTKEEIGFDKNDFLISNIGWLDKRKGQIYLIKAIHFLKSNYKIDNIKCIIIGDYGDNKDEIKKYISDNKLEDFIKLLGPKNNPFKYMKQSNLHVISSLSEGHPITAFEIYAAGLPLLAANGDGMSEIVKDKETGILVEKANHIALAKEILKFYNGKYDVNLFKENGYRYLDSFKIEDYLKKLSEIYKGKVKND
jgi:glycosyltransferase involved in cell wall biosynthesis